MNAPALPPQDDLPVRPGDVLAGKYRVERVLGSGGAGVVVEARHIALDERVALRILLPGGARDAGAPAQFLREAQAAAKVKSEHVARVTDVGTLETGAPYLVMELLEGLDLADAIERRGVYKIPDAVDHLLQACEAIAEAHALGIVHRDLRPANLFLADRPGGTPMIKVLDLGVSKIAGGAPDFTSPDAPLGSAPYMAPEQMQPARGVDHRADIYALGICLYELLAGKQPFHGDTLPQLCAEVLTGRPAPIHQTRADVPPLLAAVLERAYARNREQRYQNIAQLAAGLAPFAPERSQTSLDRIARMAGLSPAVAGSLPSASSGSDLPPPAIGYAPLSAALAAPQVYGAPDEIPIGGYQGPVSRRAAAAFAKSAPTLPEVAHLTQNAGGSRSGMIAIVAAIAIGTGLLLGGLAYFLL